MLEKITYKNHYGEEINFGENGLYLNNNDLRSYAWSYNTKNNKIAYFNRPVQEKKLPVRVKCGSQADGYNLMNQIMETADKDVIKKSPGRIIAGDYYLTCYLHKSQKSQYDLQNGLFYADLSIITDSPAWIKETTQQFYSSGSGTGQNLDYPFDFPYDFASPSAASELVNSGFADSDFRMVIYGEVTDPAVSIAGHTYSVTGYVADDEYLVIDSRDKTVTLVESDGTRVNWFSHRSSNNYIFEKIPSGGSSVLWVGDFTFEITLFEERSEPKWI